MKALFLRCLLAAVLIGPTIGFISEVASFRRASKYNPPLTDAEFQKMKNLSMNEVEATLSKRRITMTRWEWLKDSIAYSYFWKGVAYRGTVPGSGVFLACAWVGWMEKRHVQKLKNTT